MDRLFPLQGTLHDSDDDSQSSTNSSMQSWIGWFCSLSGHEFYVQVPEDFIEDEFNLTGLSTIIPYYVHALATILDMESGEFFDQQDEEKEEEEEEEKKPSDQEEDGFWKDDKVYHTKQGRVDPRVVEPYAIMLYGLIHQRYLVTRNGLRLMAERYANGQFGVCPRYLCDLCPVLPVGQSDQIGYDSVYLYCPKCLDIYTPPSSIYSCVDGAHFGKTYFNLLFLTYPEFMPKARRQIYQPHIFGFRVNEKSKTGPRNQWLRQRPPEYIEEEEEEEETAEEDEQEQVGEEEDVIEHITVLTNQAEDLSIRESSSFNKFFRRWL